MRAFACRELSAVGGESSFLWGLRAARRGLPGPVHLPDPLLELWASSSTLSPVGALASAGSSPPHLQDDCLCRWPALGSDPHPLTLRRAEDNEETRATLPASSWHSRGSAL